jgi:hypothetical protein
MTSANDSLVFLTVRGTLVPKTLEAGCKVHNETAGSAEGIAASRACGDLSHNVFSPVPGLGGEAGEILFFDWWRNAEGIGRFFSDPRVHGLAATLFSAREGVVWLPAREAFGFDLPAPVARPERFVGLVRGFVASAEHAIGVFRRVIEPTLADARRRGQLSHRLFVKLPMPGDTSGLELLGVDHWYDAAGMNEHYAALSGYEQAFSKEPATSVWQPATGGVWSEW